MLSTGFLIKGNLLAGIGIAIATIRSTTFLVFDLKHKEVPYYLVAVFILMLIGNGIFTWSGPIDLLSIAALIANTLFCKIKDQKKMKTFMIIPVVMTIFYDVFAVFLSKALLKFIELVSIIIFLIKNRNSKQKSIEQEQTETKNDLTENNEVQTNA